ncbi:ribosomal RNA small subunit methyltransferase G-like [Ylistrum balloti]|uniref:ribosomal RNA small subunit methyltransferase G-like n=1 Tax=Ylistrum balloti TaxID=509963 RepID=UPI0029057D8A|nr:ribosomal RNA small subunit methyltransferase G-like [Ylistrum balloti]
MGAIQCIDLGSGAGLPGIPLMLHLYALGVPACWYLVEKSPRKSQFLRTAIADIESELSVQLPIKVVETKLCDWETRHELPLHKGKRIILARAFRTLTPYVAREIAHVLAPAELVLYKGRKSTILEELAELDALVKVVNIVPLHCMHKKERHIVHVKI